VTLSLFLLAIELNTAMVVAPDEVAPSRFSRKRGPITFVDATHYLHQAGVSAKAFVAHAKTAGDDLDLASAKELEASWRKSWPEIQDYFDAITRALS
jgi:hypothetical protein